MKAISTTRQRDFQALEISVIALPND